MTSEAVCSDVCGVRSGAGTAKAAGERRRRRRAQVRPQVVRGREGRAASGDAEAAAGVMGRPQTPWSFPGRGGPEWRVRDA